MSMKKLCFCLLAALLLCACGEEPAVSQEVTQDVSQAVSETVSQAVSEVSQAASEETEVSCTHRYGDEPVEIVGNLYVYECADCGERKVVPQGTLIGN